MPNMQDLQLMAKGKGKARKRSGTSVETGSDQKKRKTSTSSESSGIPDWITKAKALLESNNLGVEWEVLLAAWLKFEEESGFQGSGKLGTHRRPRVIEDWIQRARLPTFRPEIKDIEGFAADFTAWWQSLQPEWRRNGNGEIPNEGGDWNEIRKPGVNGLLSVIAALFFWGNTIQITQHAAARAAWLEALGDVAYVIEHLV